MIDRNASTLDVNFLTRARRCIDAAGLVSAGAWGLLALRSWSRPDPPASLVLAVLGAAWSALFCVLWALPRTSSARFYGRLVGWALVFRALGTVGHPVLDDDWARFLWDGYTLATTGDPYAVAPLQRFTDATVPELFRHVLSHINYPELPTIYAPLSQVAFGLAYLVAPGALWPVKMILVGAELAMLAVLARHASVRGFALAAWAPLSVHETAFNAHPDVLAIALLVIGLHLVASRPRSAGMLLGAAVATKGFAALMLPLVLLRTPRLIAGVVLGGALPYLWFLVHGSHVGWDATSSYLAGWEYNSLGFAVVTMLAGAPAAKATTLVVTAAALAWALRQPTAPMPRGDVVYGCALAAAPVVNPWYVLWLLPFAAVHLRAWSIAALAIVSLAYVHDPSAIATHAHPVWVRPLEVAVVAAALAIDRWRRPRSG